MGNWIVNYIYMIVNRVQAILLPIVWVLLTFRDVVGERSGLEINLSQL